MTVEKSTSAGKKKKHVLRVLRNEGEKNCNQEEGVRSEHGFTTKKSTGSHVMSTGKDSMTHSYEVCNANQEPGPTDMSAGVMTPQKKESEMSVRLALQARKTLGAPCETVRRVMCREKDQHAFAVTNSIEFKMTLIHSVPGEKMGKMNKVAESTASFDKRNKVSGKSAADSVTGVV